MRRQNFLNFGLRRGRAPGSVHCFGATPSRGFNLRSKATARGVGAVTRLLSFDVGRARYSRTNLNFFDSVTLRQFSYVVSLFLRFGKKVFYWNLFSAVILQLSARLALLEGQAPLFQWKSYIYSAQVTDGVDPSLYGEPQFMPKVNGRIAQAILLFSLTCEPVRMGFGASTPNLRCSKLRSFDVFLQICSALKTSYMVKYKSLDRKLRKIVKNKYRFFRFYSMLKPMQRVKAGLRFTLLGLTLRSNQRMQERLVELFSDIFFIPEQSLLLGLKRKHQLVTLGALTLAL